MHYIYIYICPQRNIASTRKNIIDDAFYRRSLFVLTPRESIHAFPLHDIETYFQNIESSGLSAICANFLFRQFLLK